MDKAEIVKRYSRSMFNASANKMLQCDNLLEARMLYTKAFTYQEILLLMQEFMTKEEDGLVDKMVAHLTELCRAEINNK